MSKQPAFSKVTSYDSLRYAWTEIQKKHSPKKKGAAGVDGETLADFNANLDSNLMAISFQLRNKTYQFHPLKPCIFPKPNGKVRVICIPTIRDRIVQRALLKFLTNEEKYALKNKVSYGFIRDRSVKGAVTEAKKLRDYKPWAYKTDITSFFDKISRARLLETLNRKIRVTSLHPLLIGAMNCEIFTNNQEIIKVVKKQGIRQGKGVRQGMPLSPYFANLMLDGFDSEANKKDLSMVRYADDLIILSESKEKCFDIHRFCKNELKKIELEIPEVENGNKTMIYAPSETADFLGIGIEPTESGYSLRVTKKQKVYIKTKVMELAETDWIQKNNITISNFMNKLEGRIAGYEGAYNICDNISELSDAMRDYKRMTIARVIEEMLGVKYSTLNNRQKKFLELP